MSDPKFNIGDIVKVGIAETYTWAIGMNAEVVDIHKYLIKLKFKEGGEIFTFEDHKLSLVKSVNNKRKTYNV